MSLSPFPDFDLGPLCAAMAEMRRGAAFLASGINDHELKEVSDHLAQALAGQEADFLAKVPSGIAAARKDYETMQKEYDALTAELKDIEKQKKDLVAKMVDAAKVKSPKPPKIPALKPTLLPSGPPPFELNPTPDLLKELLDLGRKESVRPIVPGMRVSGDIWSDWAPVQKDNRHESPPRNPS